MLGSIYFAAAVMCASLAVWLFFSVFTPDAPLSAGEMVLIVGASAVAIYLVRWLFSWITARRPGG